MNARICTLAALAVLSFPAFATNNKTPDPTPPVSIAFDADINASAKVDNEVDVNNTNLNSNSNRNDNSNLNSNTNVNANSAFSNQSQGQGQDQAQKQGQSQGQAQSANNEGNSQDVTINHQRSAPSVAQGSLMIGACGAGGNAGGSNTSGSAFLGIAYIPAKCYDLLYAGAYAALGERQAACDILRKGKYGRKAKKHGIELPEVCNEATTTVIVNQKQDLTGYATKEEVTEKVDRAFKASQEK